MRGDVILTVLLVFAVLVRLWGIRAGLPFMHNPDEPTNMRVVDAMVRANDPNPHFFNYPSLAIYLWTALHLDGPLLGWIPHLAGTAPITQVMGVTYSPATGQVLLDRLASAAAGTALVGVGWATARRLTTGIAPAAVTALLLALSPTLVDYSRLVTPDILATLLVAAATHATLRILSHGTWPSYLAAGSLVGLAASAKYTAAIVAVAVIAAAALSGRRTALWRLPAAGLAAIGAFLATTPYAVLDRSEFLAGLFFESNHYATGHPGMEGDTIGFYTGMLTGVESPIAALGVAGIAVAVTRHRWRPAVVLAAFPVVYGAFIAAQVVRNDRTLMLLLPGLAVLAALAVEALPTRVLRVGAAAATVATLAAILVPALPAPGLTTWDEARAWLNANGAGRPILVESYGPWLTPSPSVSTCNRAIDCPPPPGGLIVLADEMYGRYTPACPDEHQRYARLLGLPELAHFTGNGTTLRIVAAP
ncbi:MAG: hypothetical protein QOG20_1021 [Pseudonocardiales bacterium]|jgi:4-amino-4-deoxy-L-arabinose transferase-like glycosyltransferase|nr:hypothetical protein [Pseudonocardiales bacterium]